MNSNPIFSLYVPTKILFGCGEIKKLATETLPGKKAMIVISGGTSMKKYGYLDKVIGYLTENDVAAIVYDKILPNPIKAHVMEAAAICREQKCDFIIGLAAANRNVISSSGWEEEAASTLPKPLPSWHATMVTIGTT